MNSEPSQLRALLEAAADLPGGERPEFLLRAAEAHPEWGPRLRAVAQAGPDLDGLPETEFHGPDGCEETDSDAELALEGLVGMLLDQRYRLECRLGEGGMGTVWRAEQIRPVRRAVAVKLIRRSLASKGVLARFRAERQMLAQMDHPQVAPIFDAGTAPDGRPYLVMPLIEGSSITRHADAQKLKVRARVRLMIYVCEAVTHAHQKGVVHRDLKPSNVMVEHISGRAIPKVIDFGMATSPADPASDVGRMSGTPEYMSPEQAGSGPPDIDTRTDIFSLGLLLYELAAGLPPDRKRSRSSHTPERYLESLRAADFVPPDRHVRNLPADERKALAALRSTPARRLAADIGPDLAAVIMKALRRDRELRYDTASQLSADLQAWLDRKPVSAVPNTRSYVARAFVRRNRPAVALGLALSLAVVLGSVGTAVGLVRARNKAVATAEVRAVVAKTRGVPASPDDLADHFERAAKDVSAMTLSSPEAAQTQTELAETLLGLGRVAAARDTFARSCEGLKHHVGENDPRFIRAAFGLGRAELALGDYPKAAATLARVRDWQLAADPDSEDASRAAVELAKAYRRLARYPEAAGLVRDVFLHNRDKLGLAHPATLASMTGLSESLAHPQADPADLDLFREAVAATEARYGAGKAEHLMARHNLARAQRSLGRPDEAIKTLRPVIAARGKLLGARHAATLDSEGLLGACLEDAGEPAAALEQWERYYVARRDVAGAGHPDTLEAQAALVSARLDMGREKEGLDAAQELAGLSVEHYGTGHPAAWATGGLLGRALTEAGRPVEGLPLLEDATHKLLEKLGPDHPLTLKARARLVSCLVALRRFADAKPIAEDTLARRRKALGEGHRDSLSSMTRLADVQAGLNDREAALALLDDQLGRMAAPRLPDPLGRFDLQARRGSWLAKAGTYDLALPALKEANALAKSLFGPKGTQARLATARLGVCLRDAGRASEAVPLLEEAANGELAPAAVPWVGPELGMAYLKAKRPADYLALAERRASAARGSDPRRPDLEAAVWNDAGRELLKADAFPEAETALRRELDLRERTDPADPETDAVRSLLGEALVKAKKPEGEKLLAESYQRLLSRRGKVGDEVIAEARTRMVGFLRTTGRESEAVALEQQKP